MIRCCAVMNSRRSINADPCCALIALKLSSSCDSSDQLLIVESTLSTNNKGHGERALGSNHLVGRNSSKPHLDASSVITLTRAVSCAQTCQALAKTVVASNSLKPAKNSVRVIRKFFRRHGAAERLTKSPAWALTNNSLMPRIN